MNMEPAILFAESIIKAFEKVEGRTPTIKEGLELLKETNRMAMLN